MSSVKQDFPLNSYTISSGDMRHIAIGARDIYLHYEPETGYLIQGSMSGCGYSSPVNLSEILVEYGMSCEGLKEPYSATTAGLAEQFGRVLGRLLARQFQTVYGEQTAVEPIFDCLIRSLGVPFSCEKSATHLSYHLAQCPLRAAATRTGINRDPAIANHAFISLLANLLAALDVDYALLQPTLAQVKEPLIKVELGTF